MRSLASKVIEYMRWRWESDATTPFTWINGEMMINRDFSSSRESFIVLHLLLFCHSVNADRSMNGRSTNAPSRCEISFVFLFSYCVWNENKSWPEEKQFITQLKRKIGTKGSNISVSRMSRFFVTLEMVVIEKGRWKSKNDKELFSTTFSR